MTACFLPGGTSERPCLAAFVDTMVISRTARARRPRAPGVSGPGTSRVPRPAASRGPGRRAAPAVTESVPMTAANL